MRLPENDKRPDCFEENQYNPACGGYIQLFWACFGPKKAHVSLLEVRGTKIFRPIKMPKALGFLA